MWNSWGGPGKQRQYSRLHLEKLRKIFWVTRDNIKIVLKTGSPVPWLLRGAGLCCHSCHIFLGRPLYTIIMIIVMLRIMFTFIIRLRLYAVVPSPDEQPECLQVAFKGRPQGGGHPVLVPGLTFTLGLIIIIIRVAYIRITIRSNTLSCSLCELLLWVLQGSHPEPPWTFWYRLLIYSFTILWMYEYEHFWSFPFRRLLPIDIFWKI